MLLDYLWMERRKRKGRLLAICLSSAAAVRLETPWICSTKVFPVHHQLPKPCLLSRVMPSAFCTPSPPAPASSTAFQHNFIYFSYQFFQWSPRLTSEWTLITRKSLPACISRFLPPPQNQKLSIFSAQLSSQPSTSHLIPLGKAWNSDFILALLFIMLSRPGHWAAANSFHFVGRNHKCLRAGITPAEFHFTIRERQLFQGNRPPMGSFFIDTPKFLLKAKKASRLIITFSLLLP